METECVAMAELVLMLSTRPIEIIMANKVRKIAMLSVRHPDTEPYGRSV
jgi:hypothetical protein